MTGLQGRRVPTPYGDGLLVTDPADDPVAELLLSHGAGNGVDTRDLAALARDLPAQGFTVHRFEQPWRVAGRKVATAPPTLDAGLLAASELLDRALPLVVGGRSAGARSAARCASSLAAAGCLALSFPLHPPGRPEKSRLEELTGAGVPTRVVQGERDPMGRPEEFPPGTDLVVVPTADHGFATPRREGVTEADVQRIIVESVLAWLRGTAPGRGRGNGR